MNHPRCAATRHSGCGRSPRHFRQLVVVPRAAAAPTQLQVVFVSTEVAPWSKAGGVGDVMAALPAALAARGHRVMTVAPRYSSYTDVRDTGVVVPVQLPLDSCGPQPAGEPADAAADAAAAAATAAAAAYGRADGAAQAGSSSSSSSGCVRLFMSTSRGVDRVFVDHPLYQQQRGATGHSVWPAGVVGTYCHPDSSEGGAHAPDLAAAASVLCQAALAAPTLLWGSAPREQDGEAAAAAADELALLQALLGLDSSQLLALRQGACSSSGLLLSSAARQRQQRLAAEMCHPQHMVDGIARPVLLGTGGSEVDRRWPVCDLLLQPGLGAAEPQQQGAAGPLVFIANDWPCGVLPLWLDAYREAAAQQRQQQQQQQQQHNPYLAGVLQQQHELLQAVQQHAEQRDQQQHPSRAGAVDDAQPPCSSDSALWAVQQQVEQQREQQQEQQQREHHVQQEAALDPDVLLLSDESAVSAWLQQAVGHTPGSVADASVCASLSAAVEAGQVPSERLPELLEGQLQLRQLLHQEQVLGEAIQRVTHAAVALNQEALQQQQQEEQQQEQQSLQQPAMPHSRQLPLLQGMLGRSLADARVVFAVHNAAYQGVFKGRASFDRLGLPGRLLARFVSPLAQAAARAAAAASEAAEAAASAVSTQLGALAGVLQQLMPAPAAAPDCTSDEAGGARGSSSSSSGDPLIGQAGSLGLLSGVQALLQQHQLDGAAAALVRPGAGAAPPRLHQALGGGGGAGGGGAGPREGDLLEQLHGALVAAAAQRGWEPPLSSRSPSSSWDGEAAAAAAAEAHLEVNWMRAGLAAADALVTVSDGYAAQLLAGGGGDGPPHPELTALLASKGLVGVLNGIDTAAWDPQRDPLLPAAVRYGRHDVAAGKAAAKALLQRRLGLDVSPAAPLFVFIGRLTPQKGVDVLLAAVPQLLGQEQQAAAGASSGSAASPGLQLALLGAGEAWMEAVVGQLGSRYPGRAVGVPAFNEPLAHLLMAAADCLLVPSRSEPCGLVALAGLAYGAVPLATATGGLGDVVRPAVGYRLANPGPEGDTACFRRGVASLVRTVRAAVGEYGTDSFAARRDAAMADDHSWSGPSEAWEQLCYQVAQQPASWQLQAETAVVVEVTAGEAGHAAPRAPAARKQQQRSVPVPAATH